MAGALSARTFVPTVERAADAAASAAILVGDHLPKRLQSSRRVAALSSARNSSLSALRARPGCPRKYSTSSRAVTLTLPESVIDALARVHPDLSRAIVANVRRRVDERRPAELDVFGRRAVISVWATGSLARRTGIELIPLPDGRSLIAFDQQKGLAEIELLLQDALKDPSFRRGNATSSSLATEAHGARHHPDNSSKIAERARWVSEWRRGSRRF